MALKQVSDSQLIHEWLVAFLKRKGEEAEFINTQIADELRIDIGNVAAVMNHFLSRELVKNVMVNGIPKRFRPKPQSNGRKTGPGFNAYVYTVSPLIKKEGIDFHTKPNFKAGRGNRALNRVVARREMLRGDIFRIEIDNLFVNFIEVTSQIDKKKELIADALADIEALNSRLRELMNRLPDVVEIDINQIPNEQIVKNLIYRRTNKLLSDKDFPTLYSVKKK